MRKLLSVSWVLVLFASMGASAQTQEDEADQGCKYLIGEIIILYDAVAVNIGVIAANNQALVEAINSHRPSIESVHRSSQTTATNSYSRDVRKVAKITVNMAATTLKANDATAQLVSESAASLRSAQEQIVDLGVILGTVRDEECTS